MPVWAEIMLNLIGYAGFVVVASRGSIRHDQTSGDEI